jgi:phage terminase large subunit GpA-like protein
MIKEELYRWLHLDRPTEESGEPYPPGYCHFPKYSDEYFKQLTAEQLVTRVVKG